MERDSWRWPESRAMLPMGDLWGGSYFGSRRTMSYTPGWSSVVNMGHALCCTESQDNQRSCLVGASTAYELYPVLNQRGAKALYALQFHSSVGTLVDGNAGTRQKRGLFPHGTGVRSRVTSSGPSLETRQPQDVLTFRYLRAMWSISNGSKQTGQLLNSFKESRNPSALVGNRFVLRRVGGC